MAYDELSAGYASIHLQSSQLNQSRGTEAEYAPQDSPRKMPGPQAMRHMSPYSRCVQRRVTLKSNLPPRCRTGVGSVDDGRLAASGLCLRQCTGPGIVCKEVIRKGGGGGAGGGGVPTKGPLTQI